MASRAVTLPSAGCDCSPCGTEACDPQNGRCLCKPGVKGTRCEHCQVSGAGAGLRGPEGGVDVYSPQFPCRKDILASRAVGAASPAPVAKPPRMPSATHRVGSAPAGRAPGVPNAENVRLVTGVSRSKAAGVSQAEGSWGVLEAESYTAPHCPPSPHSPSLGCECRGGHCDPHTGRCTCPPGLHGERCDTCRHPHHVPVSKYPGGHGVHCEGNPHLHFLLLWQPCSLPPFPFASLFPPSSFSTPHPFPSTSILLSSTLPCLSQPSLDPLLCPLTYDPPPPVCDHCVVLLLDDLERAGALFPTIREQLRGLNASSAAWARLHALNSSIASLQVLLSPPQHPQRQSCPSPPSTRPTGPAPELPGFPPSRRGAAGRTGSEERQAGTRWAAAGGTGRTLSPPGHPPDPPRAPPKPAQTSTPGPPRSPSPKPPPGSS